MSSEIPSRGFPGDLDRHPHDAATARHDAVAALSEVERRIINRLQLGVPLTPDPYGDLALELGLGVRELLDTLSSLLDRGILSRFGPMFQAERLGGALTLAALAVPEADFERVAEVVNAFPEVAHNYRREHHYNMWFVIACDRPGRVASVIEAITEATGLEVINLPKEEEFHVHLHLPV